MSDDHMGKVLEALDAFKLSDFLDAAPYAEDNRLWLMRNALFDVRMHAAKLHDVLRRIVTLLAGQKEAPQAPSYCKALPGQCVSLASMDGASCPRGCFEPRTYGKQPASAEKPQPVTDAKLDALRAELVSVRRDRAKWKKVAEMHHTARKDFCVKWQEAQTKCNALHKELAEARAAAREEALREVRGMLQRDYGPSEVRILLTHDIDEMLGGY
jgi:hypothetical protein